LSSSRASSSWRPAAGSVVVEGVVEARARASVRSSRPTSRPWPLVPRKLILGHVATASAPASSWRPAAGSVVVEARSSRSSSTAGGRLVEARARVVEVVVDGRSGRVQPAQSCSPRPKLFTPRRPSTPAAVATRDAGDAPPVLCGLLRQTERRRKPDKRGPIGTIGRIVRPTFHNGRYRNFGRRKSRRRPSRGYAPDYQRAHVDR